MSYWLRLMGGGLVLILAMLIGRGYSAYKDRRIAETEAFIALLSHAEGMISRFLSHGSSLWNGFSSPTLEELGLLPMLREGAAPADAFAAIQGRLSVNKSCKDRLTEYFCDLGGGYREDELKKIAACKSELEEMLRMERKELENDVKAVRATLLGAALGVIILLL